jgi:methionine synthase II (cobalamin-independent)
MCINSTIHKINIQNYKPEILPIGWIIYKPSTPTSALHKLHYQTRQSIAQAFTKFINREVEIIVSQVCSYFLILFLL